MFSQVVCLSTGGRVSLVPSSFGGGGVGFLVRGIQRGRLFRGRVSRGYIPYPTGTTKASGMHHIGMLSCFVSVFAVVTFMYLR